MNIKFVSNWKSRQDGAVREGKVNSQQKHKIGGKNVTNRNIYGRKYEQWPRKKRENIREGGGRSTEKLRKRATRI